MLGRIFGKGVRSFVCNYIVAKLLPQYRHACLSYARVPPPPPPPSQAAALHACTPQHVVYKCNTLTYSVRAYYTYTYAFLPLSHL